MDKPAIKDDQRYVVEDFSGGIVTDTPLRKMANELLQCKNAILIDKGGFEKRKGTEFMTSAGISINSEDDIWVVYCYINAATDPGFSWSECEGAVADNPFSGIFFSKAYASTTASKKKYIVTVEFDTWDNIVAYKNAWVAKGTSDGWISNYVWGYCGCSRGS